MDNTTISIIDDKTSLPDDKSLLVWLGRSIHIGDLFATYGAILALAIFAIAWYALTQTAFGRHVFAIGSNERMARLCGVAITRTKILVYTVNTPVERDRLGKLGVDGIFCNYPELNLWR